MKLKPDGTFLLSVVLLSCTMIILEWFCVQGNAIRLIIALVVLAIFLPYSLCVGKTIILSIDGFTIQFLFIRKYYSWNEVRTCKLEDYTHIHAYRIRYGMGVFISANQGSRKPWMGPILQSLLHNPMSSFFVTFYDPTLQDTHYVVPGAYCVDKNSFLSILEQWNVFVGGTN